jgi:hypothetical protein
MNIVVSGVLLIGGLFWTWGAITGRLPSMIAGLVEPKWLVKYTAPASTSTGLWGDIQHWLFHGVL